MALVDTNILSTFAKVNELELLHELLQRVEVSPNVLEEIRQAHELGYPHASDLLDGIKKRTLILLTPTAEEANKASHLPESFGRGERDSLAMAQERGLLFATNERRIVNCCQRQGIRCIWLDVILRGLWKKEILTRDEVEDLIKGIEEKDRIVITAKEEILRARRFPRGLGRV